MEQGLEEQVGNIRAQWSCQRHGKLIVAGLTDYVSNVATVFDKDPNLLIVEVALAHDICPNGSIRVAVAAWGKTCLWAEEWCKDLAYASSQESSMKTSARFWHASDNPARSTSSLGSLGA